MMAARLLGAEGDAIETCGAARGGSGDICLRAIRKRRAMRTEHFGTDRKAAEKFAASIPDRSLVPLRLKRPDVPQWRRQIVLLRAAWFGFPKL